MDNISTAESTDGEKARIEAEIHTSLAEIQKLREQMQRDQAQIEILGARTDAILTQIQVQLARLQAN